MTILTAILLVLAIAAIIYLFRYLVPPWTYLCAGLLIILLALFAFNLAGGNIGLGTRIV